ncbi:MAG: diacylglycerol kinase [Myxococcaceae bacterium]|nr:MAG: diacylglycerol kinase [Myxococcaceae bacterium]
MKNAKILHNPNAGKQEHDKKTLVALLESHGVECGYSSTKEEGWQKLEEGFDFIIVAGGDGTVRKTVVKMIDAQKKKERKPILLLPMGTANNIAKSLGIVGHLDDVVKNIHKRKLKRFDVGRIKGRRKDMLFLESFGFGIFPTLMSRMEEIPEREEATPEENLALALKELHKIVLEYPAQPYTVIIDGEPYTDHYILIEVMNTPSIGPNLRISPNADPGDGEFELIMIPESQRQELAEYIMNKIQGIEKEFVPVIIKGKKISIATPAGLLHVDDELKRLKKAKSLSIAPEAGMIEFFVQ